MDALAPAARLQALAGRDGNAGRIRQRNEARILRAAEGVFARAGFAGATMAEIAARAGVPKSNLHYYFRTKQALYRAVLANTLRLWLSQADIISAERSPEAALEQYIRAKMRLSARYPDASRVFANELLHGAPEIGDVLRDALRSLVGRKSVVIHGWIAAGRMAQIDPSHLFFTIWAATQTYADFEAQICAVLGVQRLERRDYERATEHLVALVLRGCGLTPPAPAAPSRRSSRERAAAAGASAAAPSVSPVSPVSPSVSPSVAPSVAPSASPSVPQSVRPTAARERGARRRGAFQGDADPLP